MFDLESEWTVGVGENIHSRPSVKCSCSPQPSAAVKIKDGGHNFRLENTKHSLAKITPALQVSWAKLT